MIKIQKKFLACPYSVFFDTYSGCSHGCSYCFVKNYRSIDKIEVDTTPKSILDFINGKRNTITNWIRKDFPLRWGVLSDPFQPVEKIKKVSYQILKVFAKTGYPFIVTTKSTLIRTKEYKDILRDCNFILQVSMTAPSVTSKLEKLDNFEDRLAMLDDFKGIAYKTVVRCCPIFYENLNDVLKLIPLYSQVGVRLLQVDPFYSNKKFPLSVRIGKNYEYNHNIKKIMCSKIKNECHNNNILFGECCSVGMSDVVAGCVGEDYGIFAGNRATRLYLSRKPEDFEFDNCQLKKSSAMCYHEIGRGGPFSRENLRNYTYEDIFNYDLNKNFNKRS